MDMEIGKPYFFEKIVENDAGANAVSIVIAENNDSFVVFYRLNYS